jgi:hypothetical protein
MRTLNAIELKCKLKLARAENRELRAQIKEMKDTLAFKEKALAKATLIIEKLDHNGELWNAFMGIRVYDPNAAGANANTEGESGERTET